MIRAIRPNAMARDDATMISGWNIAPNLAYVLRLLPGEAACGALLYDETGTTMIATGAAPVGTGQPCVLLPQAGQAIGMVDADLGWHLRLTITCTESQRTIRIGPAVDLPDEIHPVYGDDELALARATAAIDPAAHYIDDIAVTCPLGLGAELGDVVSVPVDGAAVVGQVESITWTATPGGAIEQAVIRRHIAIAPSPHADPAPVTPPTVANDTAETDADTEINGNVLTNDESGLEVVAVNGLLANVGVGVAGSNGGVFSINADGSWTFDPAGGFDDLEGAETAETFATYHAGDGVSEAMGTLTVVVSSSAMFVFEDPFDTLRTEFWDVAGLASAVASGGKLVTEGAANSWGAFSTSAAKYLGTIPANFDCSVELEWVGSSSDLCEIYLVIIDASLAVHKIGLYDAQASRSTGEFYASVGAGWWMSATGAAPWSGATVLRVVYQNGTLSVYQDGALRVTGNVPGPISSIRLGNSRFQSYNGKTAKWDNFRIEQV